MKKFLLSMLGAIAALTSCQKDADMAMDDTDGVVDVTVTAAMEGANVATRVIEDKGTGASVDRCIMEVYLTDGTLYKRMVVEPEVADQESGEREVKFDLRLVSSKSYEFLLWADKDADITEDADYESYNGEERAAGEGDKHYTTIDGLKKITTSYINFEGSDETRDAFYGSIPTTEITSSTALSVDLTRPFGQLNVSTHLTDVSSDMCPKYVKISYNTEVATSFNVADGSIDDEEELNWSKTAAVVDSNLSQLNAESVHLSTDYIFAPTNDEKMLLDFEMSFYSDESTLITANDNFTNIPLQRNYRTNVSGELLTKQGTINVSINPTFEEPDNTKDVTEVASVADLDVAMSDDVDKVEASYVVADKVVGDVDNYATITIPALDASQITAADRTSRSIDLKGGIEDDTTLTIKTESNNDITTDPKVVYITVPEDSESKLIIDLPNSTVYVNGNLKDVVARTAEDTFIINKGAVVDGLKIDDGNVVVYGTLKGAVTLDPGNKSAIITVYTATGDISEISPSLDPKRFIIKYIDPTLPIQNVTSGVGYDFNQLKDAVADAKANDVIELDEGRYMLAYDLSATANADQCYLFIDVDALTIKAKDGVDASKVIIDSNPNESTEQPKWQHGSLIVVNSDDVVIEGITIKASYSAYYQGSITSIRKEEPATRLLIDGCILDPGTDPRNATDGGFIFVQNDNNVIQEATIRNTTFNYAGIFNRAETLVNVENCRFNEMLTPPENFEPQATKLWKSTISIKGIANFSNCTFSSSAPTSNHIIEARRGGVVNVTNCEFPTDEGIYWFTTVKGKVIVDDKVYSTIYKVGDYYPAVEPDQTDPTGVVFEVSEDGMSGKVVSIDETTATWDAGTSVLTGANDSTNGLVNMKTIISNYSDYSAFAWVHAKNKNVADFSYEDDAKAIWYLPAVDELTSLATDINTVASAMRDWENATPISTSPKFTYWSSTEVNADLAYSRPLYLSYDSVETDKNSAEKRVRAILSF